MASQNCRVILALSGVLFVSGFGLGCTPSKPPQPKSSEQEDPVESFKQTIEDYLKGYKLAKHEKVYHVEASAVAGIPEGWRKSSSGLTSDAYTFDVQKTNSLVSPYTDIFEFETKLYVTSSYGSEEAARLATDFSSDYFVHKHRHIYAYHAGKWVLQSRKHLLWEDEWADCQDGE